MRMQFDMVTVLVTNKCPQGNCQPALVAMFGLPVVERAKIRNGEMSVRYQNLHTGKAGELRVASELLLRGYQVYLTMVDVGVDIVLGSGKTIQVKASMPRKRKRQASPFYNFNFTDWNHKPHKLDGVDFVVLWAIKDNVFYIIPSDKIGSKLTISITPNPVKRCGNSRVNQYAKFAGRWDLFGKP